MLVLTIPCHVCLLFCPLNAAQMPFSAIFSHLLLSVVLILKLHVYCKNKPWETLCTSQNRSLLSSLHVCCDAVLSVAFYCCFGCHFGHCWAINICIIICNFTSCRESWRCRRFAVESVPELGKSTGLVRA